MKVQSTMPAQSALKQEGLRERVRALTDEEADVSAVGAKQRDVVEISDEGLKLKNSIEEAKTTIKEASGDSENGPEESGRSSGMVGINTGKLARKLAAAKTKSQVRAVIAEIQRDLKECEAGKAQGMDVDEASVQAAQNLLNLANQRMGQAADRAATPEEEMAFSMAGLM